MAPTPTPAPPPLPPGAPDPSEAGISDLARLARYVFREMRAGQGACSFANPLRDPVSFAFHIEVQGGRMTEVHLAWAGVRHAEDMHRLEPPPPELSAYVECLTPRLQARGDGPRAGGRRLPARVQLPRPHGRAVGSGVRPLIGSVPR